jgi:hypothetical protein
MRHASRLQPRYPGPPADLAQGLRLEPRLPSQRRITRIDFSTKRGRAMTLPVFPWAPSDFAHVKPNRKERKSDAT